MTTLPALANPIWLAATTRQQHLAYGNSAAMRFHKEVVPLAAISGNGMPKTEREMRWACRSLPRELPPQDSECDSLYAIDTLAYVL